MQVPHGGLWLSCLAALVLVGCVRGQRLQDPSPSSTWVGTYRYELVETSRRELVVLELLADGRARLLHYSWHVRFEGTPGFRDTEPMPDVGRWAVRDHILQLQLNAAAIVISVALTSVSR